MSNWFYDQYPSLQVLPIPKRMTYGILYRDTTTVRTTPSKKPVDRHPATVSGQQERQSTRTIKKTDEIAITAIYPYIYFGKPESDTPKTGIRKKINLTPPNTDIT